MTTVTMEEAQSNLPELIHQLGPGEELVITQDSKPVARLKPESKPDDLTPRQPGTMRGSVLYMAPDFDAPLDEFKEYME